MAENITLILGGTFLIILFLTQLCSYFVMKIRIIYRLVNIKHLHDCEVFINFIKREQRTPSPWIGKQVAITRYCMGKWTERKEEFKF